MWCSPGPRRAIAPSRPGSAGGTRREEQRAQRERTGARGHGVSERNLDEGGQLALHVPDADLRGELLRHIEVCRGEWGSPVEYDWPPGVGAGSDLGGERDLAQERHAEALGGAAGAAGAEHLIARATARADV